MIASRPLTIGITCYPTFGGSGIVATELGLALARRGHRIHFIATGTPVRLVEEPASSSGEARFVENVRFHSVAALDYPLFDAAHSPYPIALASKMADVARRERLDLLHAHYAVPHATSGYLAREVLRSSGEPAPRLVTTLHGTDITLVGSDPSYLPVTRFSIVASDAVTTPSAWLREATFERLGVPRSRAIDVIPNFVDEALYHPRAGGAPRCDPRALFPQLPSSAWDDPARRPLVLAHGSNFRPLKRAQDCVRILDEVRRARPAVLVLFGDGPERARVEALARELGLGGLVASLGEQLSVAGLLRCCDLFLLPSETEAFGLSALEALACGVPVVGSRAGGLIEVVRDGEDGFLCPVGDVEAMAAAVVRLAAPSLRERFAASAREDVLARFRRDPIVDEWERFYERVLRGT